MKHLNEYIQESKDININIDNVMEQIEFEKNDSKKVLDILYNEICWNEYKLNKHEASELLDRLNKSNIKIHIAELQVGMLRELLSNILSALPPSQIADLGFIDISNVRNVCKLFGGTNNNIRCIIDLSKWDVSKVYYFDSMFLKFKGKIIGLENWDTSSAQLMGDMFRKATNFNADLSGWDVSKVRYMDYMFKDAKSFDSDLENWNTSSVKSKTGMFNGSGVTKLPSWYDKGAE